MLLSNTVQRGNFLKSNGLHCIVDKIFYFAEGRKCIAVGHQLNLYVPYPGIKEYLHWCNKPTKAHYDKAHFIGVRLLYY
jgi:hypothetical protein